MSQPTFLRGNRGVWIDGANGHDYVRRELSDMLAFYVRDDWDAFCCVLSLRGDMPDDAWDEDEAIERLNDLCEPGVYFALCEGDVRLMDDD